MKRIYISLIWLFIFLGMHAQQTSDSLTIMTYNLYRDFLLNTQNSRIPEFAKVILACEPDIVALQEVRGINNLNKLKKATGMEGKRYNTLPFYGIGMLWHSRLGTPTITTHRMKALKDSKDKEDRAFMTAEFEDFYFINSHFSLDKNDRLQMVEAIIDFAQSVSKPVYLAGDLNATPDDLSILKLLANRFIILNHPKHHTFRSDNPQKLIDFILLYLNNAKTPTIIDRGTTDFPKEYLEGLSDHLPYWVKVK